MIIQLHGQFETTNYGDMLLCILFANYLHYNGHQVMIKNACEELYSYFDYDVLKDGKPDKMICCGGGYLCDGDLHFSLHMIKRIFGEMARCRLNKIPYIIVGAGSKPFKNYLTKPIMRWCINGADNICVRNDETKLDLSKLGVKKEITVTTDNVMAIDESIINPNNLAQAEEKIKMFKDSNKKIILLHLNYLPLDGNKKINDGGKNLEKAILSFAKNNEDYNFIVFYDHKIDTFIKQCDSLFKQLPADRKILYNGDTVDSVLSIIYLSDIVITTKLHVGITGVALNKNVISFPMHIKAKRFFKQFSEEDRCILLENCDNVEDIESQIKYYVNKEMNSELIDKLRKLAKSNYQLIDNFTK